MPICRETVQLTYCYQWNTSSVCLEKEEVPGAKVTAIKLLANLRRQVVPFEARWLSPLPLVLFLPPCHFLVFSPPEACFFPLPPSVPSPNRGMSAGAEKRSHSQFESSTYSWGRGSDGGEMGSVLRTGWSFYWPKQSQGREEGGRPFLPPQMNFKLFPTLPSRCEVLFLLSTLLLTRLPLWKSFLGFALKGQRSQKDGAAQLEKSHSSNYKGACIPGALVCTRLGTMSWPWGHSWGPPDSRPCQLQVQGCVWDGCIYHHLFRI